MRLGNRARGDVEVDFFFSSRYTISMSLISRLPIQIIKVRFSILVFQIDVFKELWYTVRRWHSSGCVTSYPNGRTIIRPNKSRAMCSRSGHWFSKDSELDLGQRLEFTILSLISLYRRAMVVWRMLGAMRRWVVACWIWLEREGCQIGGGLGSCHLLERTRKRY